MVLQVATVAGRLRLVLRAAVRTLLHHRGAVSQGVVEVRAVPAAAGHLFNFEIAAQDACGGSEKTSGRRMPQHHLYCG